MSSLQDLVERFNAVKVKLSGDYEQRLAAAREAIATRKNEIETLRSTIEKNEKHIDILKGLNPEDFTQDVRNAHDKAKSDLILENKNLEYTIKRLEQEIQDQGVIEKEITDDVKEMDAIIAEFAGDERINQHLQEAIKIKHGKEIEKKEKERKAQVSLKEELSKALAEDPVLTPLVAQYQEMCKVVKELPLVPYGSEQEKADAEAKKNLKGARLALEKAVKAKFPGKKVALTQKDFESIAGGPVDGRYEVPSIDENIEKIDTVISTAKQKVEEKIERLQAAIISARKDPAEASRLQGLINAKQAEIDRIDTEISNEEAVIQTLTTEIDEIIGENVDVTAEQTAYDEAVDNQNDIEADLAQNAAAAAAVESKIASLETKISELGPGGNNDRLKELTDKLPDGLLDEYDAAEEAYNTANGQRKANGFVGKAEREAYKKEYEEFIAADQAVRKAFLACQTTDDPTTAKEDLKTAIEEYKRVAEDLAQKSGYSIENWHDYLVYRKAIEAKKEDIGEEYYADTMDRKLANIKKDFKDEFKKDPEGLGEKYDLVSEASKAIYDLQESVLKGEDVEFSNIENNIQTYGAAMVVLCDSLKDKGAKALNSVKDLFGSLAGKLVKLGIFAKIKNFFTPAEKRTVSGAKTDNKSRKSTYTDIDAKKVKLESIEAKLGEHLTKEELEELKRLREGDLERADLEQQLADAKQRKDDLGEQAAGLITERDDAIRIVEEKRLELEAARSRATLAPEVEEKVNGLKTKKQEAQDRLDAANTRKTTAEKEKSDLQKEFDELPEVTPVVENGVEIAHGNRSAKGLTSAAIDAFDREDDEGR